jgi:hypothetical protein
VGVHIENIGEYLLKDYVHFVTKHYV